MNQTRRSALGRGLSALIPEASEPNADERGQVQHLPIEQIRAADTQPRTEFDQDRIDSLSASITADGILQPIVVRRVGQSTFTIIAGERRYRASKQAGLTHVPVIIRDVTEGEAYELALIENVQREDLNPIEEAEAYGYLASEREMSHEAIAKRVGRDRVTVSNGLRLLKLRPSVRKRIADGVLTAGHGRAILMAPPEHHESLAAAVVKGAWSVRKTEAEAKSLKSPETVTQPEAPSLAHRAVEDQLRGALGAPVRLVNKKGKGRIEIRYHSVDELERLIEMLSTLEGK